MTRPASKAHARTQRSNIYDEVTTKIIAELEAGRLPWVQPWGSSTVSAPLAMPRNAATDRGYSGINVLILWGAVVQHGFATQGWGQRGRSRRPWDNRRTLPSYGPLLDHEEGDQLKIVEPGDGVN